MTFTTHSLAYVFLSQDIFQGISARALLFIIFAIGLKSPAPQPAPPRAPLRGRRVGATHPCSPRKLLLIMEL